MKLNRNSISIVTSLFLALSTGGASVAAIVPFTENFTNDSADWRANDQITNLTWNAAGGPDGSSYASGNFSFQNQAEGGRPAILRAHDEFGPSGSSGGAFVGNWLSEGVTGFSMWVRHNAPVPLNFYARYADPANSPAAASLEFIPVQSNTWTKVTFSIAFGTPNLFLEGFPSMTLYNNTFDSIGHVQIGADTPAELVGDPTVYTFDLDQPTLLPEPASAALIGLLGSLVVLRRRPRVNRGD